MPLSKLRVIEIGALPAAAYAARLLADFGADVIKFEPPEGDPMRRAASLVAVGPGQHESAAFAFLNFGKQSRIGGLAEAEALLSTADVCISSTPEFDAAALQRAHPHLIVVDISWFGRSGPYAEYGGSDTICRALAGLVQTVGPKEGPPLVAADFQALTMAGLSAVIAIVSALMARRRGGDGRALELSVHEACIAYAELQTADGLIRGARQERIGVNRFWPTYPVGIYPAKGGWLGVTLVTPAQWQGFCAMLGLDALGTDPGLVTGMERIDHAAALEAQFLPILLERTPAEWFAEALARRLPIVPVPDMDGIRGNAEFRARGAVAPIDIGGRILDAPGNPLHLTRTPPRRGGRVPALGSAVIAARPQPAAGNGTTPPALAALRIIDLSMGWAGPLASRHMADLGADVVKIEACQYPDWWRGVDFRPHVLEQRLYEKSGRFNALNRNKRGVTLDLTTPEGVAAVKQLVVGADAVVENYAAGVLEKLGLDYAALRAVNPGIVMLSMCAFGSTSAWSDCRAYGSTLEHASGLPSLAGRPGDPPVMGHIAFGDATGGLNGAAALLIALLHRDATGEGQHIDLAQVECMLAMTGPAMIASAAGTPVPRLGNRHADLVPHGCFPCAGTDAWVCVAIADDAMWQRCAVAIGRDDLATLPLAARRAQDDRLEAVLSAWTAARTADAAMTELQAAGVIAGVARAPLDLFEDPHLRARGFWQTLDRPFTGPFPQSSLPFRDGAMPYPILTPAPTLGEHTDAVLRDLLGYSDATRADLARRHITGTTAVPPRRRSA